MEPQKNSAYPGKARRVFLIVLDSVGAGEAPDAARFGDVGAHTLLSVSASPEFRIPNLVSMGLGNVPGLDFLGVTASPTAACGKCAEACPSGAITQNPKGVYMVSKKLCTGCGKCVEACPFGLIVKDEATPYSSKCTACGICVKACPMELLEIVEK